MGQDSQQGGKPSQAPQQQITRPAPPKPAPLQPVTITKGGWEKPGQSEKR